MKLYDVFVKTGQFRRWDGTFGVEIETETKDDYAIPQFKYWNMHVDNSLRGIGREYVLNAPMKFGEELDIALEEFRTKTEKIPFIQDSNSTSVHVHVNMLNETFTTFGNFITAYTLVENILVRYSGESRLSNLFCLPMVDAEETASNIKSMFQNFEKKNFKFIHNFTQETCKYAALNLSSLPRFGSLEIRTFRGTSKVDEIRDWVGILNNILNYSRTAGMTPHDIVVDYKNRGPEVLTDIFGAYRGRLRYGDEGVLLKKSLFYASSNAWAVKDWVKLDEEPKAAVNRKTIDLDKLSVSLFNSGFAELSGEQQELVIREMERLANRPFVDDLGRDWAEPQVRNPALDIPPLPAGFNDAVAENMRRAARFDADGADRVREGWGNILRQGRQPQIVQPQPIRFDEIDEVQEAWDPPEQPAFPDPEPDDNF